MEEHIPALTPVDTLAEPGNTCQDAESIFRAKLGDAGLELIFFERDIVDVELAGIAVICLGCAAALRAPPLIVILAESDTQAVNAHGSLNGRDGRMVCNLSVRAKRLDLEIGASLAILSVKEPAEGIVHGGLSGGIITEDGCTAALEIQIQVAASLEINDAERFQRNDIHVDFSFLLHHNGGVFGRLCAGHSPDRSPTPARGFSFYRIRLRYFFMWITSFRLIDPALCQVPVVSHRYPVSKKVRAGYGEPHPAEGRIALNFKVHI